jgi:hypothetical protein
MSLGVISGRRPSGLVLSFLLAVAGILLPAPALAQPPSNLSLLQPLAEGRAKVDVIWGPRREFVRGKLLDVTDSALLLEGRKGRTEVPAGDVLEVWSPGGPRYRKPVIVGSAIGLGFGLLAMAGNGDCNDPTSLVSLAACSHLPDNEESECAGRTYGITAGVMAVLTGYSVARQRHNALAYDASRPVPAASSVLVLQPMLGPGAVGIRGAFSF